MTYCMKYQIFWGVGDGTGNKLGGGCVCVGGGGGGYTSK